MNDLDFLDLLERINIEPVELDKRGDWQGIDIESSIENSLYCVVWSATMEVSFVNYGDGIRQESQRTEINKLVDVFEVSMWIEDDCINLTEYQKHLLIKTIGNKLNYIN